MFVLMRSLRLKFHRSPDQVQERIEREQWLQANKKDGTAVTAPDADADEGEEDSQVMSFSS